MGWSRSTVLSVVAAAYGLSAMGDQVALVTLTLHFHDLGRSGSAVAALTVAGILPIVVLGPLAAPVLDRVEPRRLIVLVASLQAVAAAGLALVDSPPAQLALLALLGAGLAVVSPALSLLVPRVAGEDRTAAGFARLETFRSVGNVAGPALAGLAVAAVTWRAALLADALTFGVLALALAVVRIREQPSAAPGRARWREQVAQGTRALSGDRVLRTAIVSLACAVVFTAMMSVARVFFVRDDLGASDGTFGILVTCHTAGMLAASALLAPRIPLAWQPRVLAGSGLLMGGALIIIAAVPLRAVAIGGFLLTGVANALQSLAIRNLVHARVPSHLRGRAFASTSAVLNGSNLAGTALGGPAVTLLGGGHTLEVSGAGTLLASIAALPGLLRVSNGVTEETISQSKEAGIEPSER